MAINNHFYLLVCTPGRGWQQHQSFNDEAVAVTIAQELLHSSAGEYSATMVKDQWDRIVYDSRKG